MQHKYIQRAKRRRSRAKISRFERACKILGLPPGIYPKTITIMMAGLG